MRVYLSSRKPSSRTFILTYMNTYTAPSSPPSKADALHADALNAVDSAEDAVLAAFDAIYNAGYEAGHDEGFEQGSHLGARSAFDATQYVPPSQSEQEFELEQAYEEAFEQLSLPMTDDDLLNVHDTVLHYLDDDVADLIEEHESFKERLEVVEFHLGLKYTGDSN